MKGGRNTDTHTHTQKEKRKKSEDYNIAAVLFLYWLISILAIDECVAVKAAASRLFANFSRPPALSEVICV